MANAYFLVPTCLVHERRYTPYDFYDEAKPEEAALVFAGRKADGTNSRMLQFKDVDTMSFVLRCMRDLNMVLYTFGQPYLTPDNVLDMVREGTVVFTNEQ